MPTVIFVANRGFTLTSSRLLLIQRFLTAGWQVVAATAQDNQAAELSRMGVIVEPVTFHRGGLALRSDITALLSLIRIYRHYRPHLIHHFSAKPIILGSIGSCLANPIKIVNTITGLGHAFIHGGFTRVLAATGYRWLLSRSAATIFQNPDDRNLFIEQGWVPNNKARLIVSSGVDTKRFFPNVLSQKQSTPIRVLMVARLLWEKGIREFVEAAEIVKKKHPQVCFDLAGEWDTVHPDAVDKLWIQTIVNKGVINFSGYFDNMVAQLQTTDIFVLPSYREGMPRVLLEAAACGLPVITTDTPGCREAVIDGKTGRLVPLKNSQALAEAIVELIEDAELCQKMGRAGRKRIEEEFDICAITEEYLNVYQNVGIEI